MFFISFSKKWDLISQNFHLVENVKLYSNENKQLYIQHMLSKILSNDQDFQFRAMDFSLTPACREIAFASSGLI